MPAAPLSAADALVALRAAWAELHGAASDPPGLVFALAQALGEGSLSHYFLGTNNFGAMHATQGFAARFAKVAGYGMVAFLDHSPAHGAYITRMAVYPTPEAGAAAYLALLARSVDLETASDVHAYAEQLYAHGYYEGFASPVTPLAQRQTAIASGTLTTGDQKNISDYAALISRNVPAARAAAGASATPTCQRTGPAHRPPSVPGIESRDRQGSSNAATRRAPPPRQRRTALFSMELRGNV